MTKDETNKHFAQRFDGAVARVQLALLDPDFDLGPLPNRLLLAASGYSLCMTDAPCGAGAATFGLLTNLAELRRNQVLPRLPLDVHLLGAELSDQARAYAAELFDGVRNELEEQAIFLNPQWLAWDVADPVSTSDLVRRMIQVSGGSSNHLVLVANFSGFLSSRGRQKQAKGPFEEILRYAGGGNGATVLWIEPLMKKVVTQGGLFEWLNQKLLEPAGTYIRRKLGGNPPGHYVKAEFRVFRAFAPKEDVRVTLAATIFETGRFQ